MTRTTENSQRFLVPQATLEAYLKSLISLPVKEKVEIIAFFTSDVVRETQKPVVQAGYKEGYLTKRGKNFGGWKTRYFVLQGPSLEYYESVSIFECPYLSAPLRFQARRWHSSSQARTQCLGEVLLSFRF